MTTQPLSLVAGFDRSLAWCRGDSVRYLVVDLAVANVLPDEKAVSPKLNLAFVVDCSGSMEGDRLRAAKAAVVGVVERLPEGTVLSLVSFASTAQNHCERVEITASNRTEIIQKIGSLTARDSTNLAAGWLQGAELVALEMNARPSASHRVVVLSDGKANNGIVDPGSLARHAGELRKRGLNTSTVGIGDDYQHSLLQVIADQGGGRMHDAATPDEIVEVFLGELQQIVNVAAEGIELEIEYPPGVEIGALGGHPCERRGGKVICSLGSLLAGTTRRAVLKVTCPEGTISSKLTFTVQARYRQRGGAEPVTTAAVTCGLTYATGQENTGQPRDIVRSLEVARLWQAHIVRRVTELNTDHLFNEATDYIDREIRYFRRFCNGLEGTGELIAELELTRDAASRPWSPRAQKEVLRASVCAAKQEPDYRSAPRRRWSAYLAESTEQP